MKNSSGEISVRKNTEGIESVFQFFRSKDYESKIDVRGIDAGRYIKLGIIGGISLITTPLSLTLFDKISNEAVRWILLAIAVISTFVYLFVLLYFILSPLFDVLSGERFDIYSQVNRNAENIKFAQKLRDRVKSSHPAVGVDAALKFAGASVKLEIDLLSDNFNFLSLFFVWVFAVLITLYLFNYSPNDDYFKIASIILSTSSSIFIFIFRVKANIRLKKLRRQLATIEQAQNL